MQACRNLRQQHKQVVQPAVSSVHTKLQIQQLLLDKEGTGHCCTACILYKGLCTRFCTWTERMKAQVYIKVVSKAFLGLVDLRTYAERDKTSQLSESRMTEGKSSQVQGWNNLDPEIMQVHYNSMQWRNEAQSMGGVQVSTWLGQIDLSTSDERDNTSLLLSILAVYTNCTLTKARPTLSASLAWQTL